MIFSLSILLMGIAAIIFMASIINSQACYDKAAMEFMEEIRKIVGGTISEYKILSYRLSICGTYEGRRVDCLYRRYPRESLPSPQLSIALTPLTALKVKHFPFVFPTVAQGITLRKGVLVCKQDVIQYPKLALKDMAAILDRLVEAEKNFAKHESHA